VSLSNDSRRLLGAVLAGGRATRFGGDKGAALLDGVALIDHAAQSLSPYVEEIVVCGRHWPGYARVDDRPSGGLGPLAGINAALHAAAGYDAVVTIGGDMPQVPTALLDALTAGGSRWCVEAPIVGCWEVALAPLLDAHLAHGVDHSVRRWASLAGATRVAWGAPIVNVNTPAELAAL
jgi:molybdenum cofactor guanylyltransferase